MLNDASLRGRLLVASLAMVLVGLATADAVTYLALRSFLLDQAELHLEEAADTVEHAIRPDGQVDTDDLAAADDGGLIAPGMFVQRRRADGTVMTLGGRAHAQPRLPDPLPRPDASGDGTRSTFRAANVQPGGADLLVQVRRSGTEGALIVVARSVEDIDRTLGRLLRVEVGGTILVLGACAAFGAVLVRTALRPLDDIGRTASEIAGGDLTRRIERTERRTEVGRLGRALNDMLHQIEVAFAARSASEEALRRSEQRLRRFVADASHELRTPLAAVAAYAELSERALDTHPGDLRRLLDRIGHESRRMGMLVGDLLLLSRLDQGRPLERDPVDLGLVASEAVDTARAIDPDTPLALSVEGLIEVTGDRARIRQVIDNLLSNARLHPPASTPIEVDVRADNAGRAIVAVVDHGPHIDDQLSDRLFERFHRVDGSRARTEPAALDGSGRVPGAGLGLAIVRAITQAHAGTVTVAPTPGGGATFTVSLPLLEASTATPGRPGQEAVRDSAGDGDGAAPSSLGRADNQTIIAT